jgi:hypothetical protein
MPIGRPRRSATLLAARASAIGYHNHLQPGSDAGAERVDSLLNCAGPFEGMDQITITPKKNGACSCTHTARVVSHSQSDLSTHILLAQPICDKNVEKVEKQQRDAAFMQSCGVPAQLQARRFSAQPT